MLLCARTPTSRSEKKDELDVAGRLVRKSDRVDRRQTLAANTDDSAQDPKLKQSEFQYRSVIEDAKRCVGHGADKGSFPEEWDAQLLVDCGLSTAGHRVVLFVPGFLMPIIDDQDELDRAFRYILMTMDSIAMHQKYIFIYCCLGMDWSHPNLSERLRLAYDILPKSYTKNLKRFYILHPVSSTRLTLYSFYAWLSAQFWAKVQYASSIEEICEGVHPSSDADQAELHRRFPQAVQRLDAWHHGEELPVNFGVPLRDLCNGFGVDFTDHTTGRWYPKLPPAVIFMCEALERDADEALQAFSKLFDVDGAAAFSLLDIIDKGDPLPRDLDPALLWWSLKVWLDCLPSPLLSSQVDIFHSRLSTEVAYVGLYIVSFLHTMCELARESHAELAAGASSVQTREEAPPENVEAAQSSDDTAMLLTPALAAKVFTPSFLRPRELTPDAIKDLPLAESLVQTLIEYAEDKALWIGGQAPNWNKTTSKGADDESDES
eukprot:TRINITY_DN17768_c0_g1_i2.p1 TRINITY_DN17768_c0_g1~~TRINITY_DN17768_c0_g1_i2.p1  ORF type:complete len:490 (+),score=93.29 TRINITY_DN17768_c0_g1_i2:52-1521(+)